MISEGIDESESLIQQSKDWNWRFYVNQGTNPGVVWIPNPTEQGLKPLRIAVSQPCRIQSESLIQQSKDWNINSFVLGVVDL